METQFYTLPQLARIWGVSRQRVHVWVKEGRIPAIQPGREYLVRAEDARRPEPALPQNPAESTG